MNFWHLQMHSDNRSKFPASKLVEILETTHTVGIGDWPEGEEQINSFKKTVRIGDVIAIRDGMTPVALVKVIGDCYYENSPNPNLDWYEYRRKIEVLDYYKRSYNFKIPKAMGTFSICGNHHAATSKVIIDWYRRTTRTKLMDSIKLSEERKQQVKALWEKYKNQHLEDESERINRDQPLNIADWKIYKEKIKNGTLALDDYTNTLSKSGGGIPAGYLCNFLERGTRHLMGSAKPGTAIAFGVKLNNDGESYTIGRKRPNESRADAEVYYDEEVKPLIQNIVGASELDAKIDILESSNYAAKQVLRRMVALDHPNDFIYIYSDDVINSLYDEFIDGEQDQNLAKSRDLKIVLTSLLGVDTILDNELLSRFLWKYSNFKGIADRNTPNVILYGPPGTGKTYTVQESLDFICQGDTRRYKFIQFHPSFTYEDFIEGIKPKGVTPDGNIKFELVDGIFKSFCKKAKLDPDNDYYFVVDEINRANLSSVFGETLLCLEKDYRHDVKSNYQSNLYQTQYSSLIDQMIEEDPKNKKYAYEYVEGKGTCFGVPSNVFFIGMMNDVDKSIDTFDLALRRRFKWVRKDCDYDVVQEETKFKSGDEFHNISNYRRCCESLNNYISRDLGLGRSYEFGHSFYMKMSGIAFSKTISKANLKTLFELHLRPTLREYLRSLYPEQELDKRLEKALTVFQGSI